MPQRIPMHKPIRCNAPRRCRDIGRPNAAARGYCNAAHRAWRLAVLTRDGWRCQVCGRLCSGQREAHADHIVPISQGGARHDVANGQCLCVRCHTRKTMADQAATASAAPQIYPAPPNGGRAAHATERNQ